MKRLLSNILAAALLTISGTAYSADFCTVKGHDIIQPNGEKLFIRGTNLGNWLNPEGYMFGFKKTNSPGRINQMLCELVGPDAAADFWQQFKDNYITRDDIMFIASTGANAIRIPFHYKLFTNEDYMGLNDEQEGFRRLDQVLSWCRDAGLYAILDMHDCPGGQTGDNIDDSYGYPWLMVSEKSQKQFCDIWKKIAERYKDNPVILGYDLMNEPIAPYFGDDMEMLNSKLDPLYRRVVKEIRTVDPNHIVMIGGAQWNGNFGPLSTGEYDDNLMFTCHRYGGPASVEAIGNFIEFRDRANRPMYMGEIGHNTPEWQADFCRAMEKSNIGYTFWPYKKIDNSSFVGFQRPEMWDSIVAFSEAPRGAYDEVRKARPNQQLSLEALNQLIENIKFKNCKPEVPYIRSLGLKVEE